MAIEIARQLREMRDRLDALATQGGQGVVYLSTRKESTSFDGDSFSSGSKTEMDLSALYSGVPAGISAVYVEVLCRDSGSAVSTTLYGVILDSTNTSGAGQATACNGITNDAKARGHMWIKCNSDGNIYYQMYASGVGTLDVEIYVWGYLL